MKYPMKFAVPMNPACVVDISNEFCKSGKIMPYEKRPSPMDANIISTDEISILVYFDMRDSTKISIKIS